MMLSIPLRMGARPSSPSEELSLSLPLFWTFSQFSEHCSSSESHCPLWAERGPDLLMLSVSLVRVGDPGFSRDCMRRDHRILFIVSSGFHIHIFRLHSNLQRSAF